MRSPLILALCGLLAGGAAAAQAPHGVELGLAAGGALSDPGFAGGGALVALRPGGRFRLQGLGLAGRRGGRLAGRMELSGQFLLAPGEVRGVGAYGLAGIAGAFGPTDAGYVLLGLGLEARPGGRQGWWVEVGVAGGARLSLGWRWRSLSWSRGGP